MLRQLYADSEFDHTLRIEKDYIDLPKEDGYRSVHLVYRYKGNGPTACYDDQQIEIQLRTHYQHAWATAVEAVGTFTKQALKWRGGSEDWHRFFVLMSAAIAHMEQTPMLSNAMMQPTEIKKELAYLVDKLDVQKTLNVYNLTLNYVGNLKQSKARLLLVQMNPDLGNVTVQGFLMRESQLADYRYNLAEKQIDESSSNQAVLVKVDSVKQLPKAYPNYFLDTKLFTKILDEVLAW